MLANPAMFGIEGGTPDDQAQCAWDKLDTIKKSEFALKHAIGRHRLVPARLHPRRIEVARAWRHCGRRGGHRPSRPHRRGPRRRGGKQ